MLSDILSLDIMIAPLIIAHNKLTDPYRVSTKIIDVTGSEAKIYQGIVPKNSVVIPGTLPKKFPAGEFGTPCALIIGQRKESTDLKTSLNDVLRNFQIAI